MTSGTPVNIIRLSYEEGVGSARLLGSADVEPLMRDPLLRSAGALEGLFFRHVIVTEGDADRSFYEEINERLVAANDPRGIGDCLFLNAQNWQTTSQIAGPLRKIGVPCAIVIDLETLISDSASTWSKITEAAHVPAAIGGTWVKFVATCAAIAWMPVVTASG